MDRRSLLKLMLGTALAESMDFEQLLWTPKSIITVPAMPTRPAMYILCVRILETDDLKQIEALESGLPLLTIKGRF